MAVNRTVVGILVTLTASLLFSAQSYQPAYAQDTARPAIKMDVAKKDKSIDDVVKNNNLPILGDPGPVTPTMSINSMGATFTEGYWYVQYRLFNTSPT